MLGFGNTMANKTDAAPPWSLLSGAPQHLL